MALGVLVCTLALLGFVTPQPLNPSILEVDYAWNRQDTDRGERENCPRGYKANAFRIKFDRTTGASDKRGLTGIQLECYNSETGSRKVITSGQSSSGTWSQRWARCDGNGYLTSFALRVQSWQGIGDDTTVNDIAFNCRYPDASEVLLASRDGGQLGNLGSFSPACQPDKAICGMKTFIDETGISGDWTGLDDVIFFCC